ncbi:zf-HC2 domain-containing protein, partial [Streptomyces hydrogenans]
MTGANGEGDDLARAPWIPGPREPADDHADLSDPAAPLVLSHTVLKSLLGAWALSACSAAETRAVEDHLTACAPCADEALRLR